MDTILAFGATGECVIRFTALARAAGIDVPQLADNQVLDDDTIAKVLTRFGMSDAGERAPEPGQVIKGLVIDQKAWDVLRVAAAANTGLTQPSLQGASAQASAPAVAGDGSSTPSPQGAGVMP